MDACTQGPSNMGLGPVCSGKSSLPYKSSLCRAATEAKAEQRQAGMRAGSLSKSHAREGKVPAEVGHTGPRGAFTLPPEAGKEAPSLLGIRGSAPRMGQRPRALCL